MGRSAMIGDPLLPNRWSLTGGIHNPNLPKTTRVTSSNESWVYIAHDAQRRTIRLSRTAFLSFYYQPETA
jgi:hypothetical protein